MIGESAAAILAKRNAQAEANRRAMPTVTAWLDDLRRTFPDARIRYAEEGGHVVGKKSMGYEVSSGEMKLTIGAAVVKAERVPISNQLKERAVSQEAMFA